MTHPCASHIETCDHCALCEAGVCCAGLSVDQQAQLLALIQAKRFQADVVAEPQARAEQFRQAVTVEAARTFSLADLLHIEAERQVLGAPPEADWRLSGGGVAGLPVPTAVTPAAPDSIPTRKEVRYVPVARSTR